MKIDNRDLMPKWVPDSEVILENDMPDWIKGLIMAEIHLRTFTKEKTLAAAIEKLDHFVEMGVNCLWITPVNDRGIEGNGYGNLGPGTIDPRLTGVIGYDEPWRKTDYDEGWKIFKNFVDEAHNRNIRIYLDIVTWGLEYDSELIEQKPEWFVPGIRGLCSAKSRMFNWTNRELREWFTSHVVDVALKTGIDGIRFDMEPMYASYLVIKEIRRRIRNAGKKISLISEAPNERLETFDFEQFGIADRRTKCNVNQRLFVANDIVDSYNNGCVPNNIVDCIKAGYGIGYPHLQWAHKGGMFRYYTSQLSCHDYPQYNVCGSRMFAGYQGIFGPFIPLWMAGEEWDNPKTHPSLIYHNPLDWDALEKEPHKSFFEDFKKMLRIRRTYTDIFTNFAEQNRESNICAVETVGPENLQSYARYSENRAILVIPNRVADEKEATFTVHVPFEEMGLNKEIYTVTDLWTDKVLMTGTRDEVENFKATVPFDSLGIYLVD